MQGGGAEVVVDKQKEGGAVVGDGLDPSLS